MHVPSVSGIILAGAAVIFVLWALGNVGKTVLRFVLWGACGTAVYVLLGVLRVPSVLDVSVNPVTVGTAAVLGPVGMALTIAAHALFP